MHKDPKREELLPEVIKPGGIPDSIESGMDDLLRFDPLYAAEKVLGKSDDGVAGLGMLLLNRRQDLLKSLAQMSGDTYMGIPVADLISLLGQNGFQKVLEIPFESKNEFFRGEPGDVETYQDTFYIFWDARRGLLLCFDTYSANTAKTPKDIHVNSGNVYFNWRPKDKGIFDFPVSGGMKMTARPGNRFASKRGARQSEALFRKYAVAACNLDIREGLFRHLNDMERHGTFLSEWRAKPFMWLLTWSESRYSGGSKDKYTKIVEERIASLPEHVRAAISCPGALIGEMTKKEKKKLDEWLRRRREKRRNNKRLAKRYAKK